MGGCAVRWLGGVALAVLAGCAAPSGSPWPALAAVSMQEPAQEPAQKPAAPPPQDPWRPPAPAPGEADWVRLKSGEWLKGEMRTLRRHSLEFQSAKLGTVTLSWSDVVELRSSRTSTVVLDDRQTVQGTLLLRDGELVVGTAEGERRVARGDVLSIVPGEALELNYWSGKTSFGFTSQSGNTDQVSMNGRVSLRRRAPFSRLAVDYLGNFGKVDGVENANNHRASAQWDLFVSKRVYLTPLDLGYFHDRFQNINLQVTPSAGGGYHVLDEPGLKWDVGGVGGWRYTRFESVPAGEPDDDSTASVGPRTRLQWNVNSTVRLGLDYRVEIGVPDTKDTNHRLVTTVSVDLVGELDLDVTFQWDRVGDPRPSSSGEVPERDDFRTTVGLGWSF